VMRKPRVLINYEGNLEIPNEKSNGMCHSIYFSCSVDLDILCSGPFSGEKYQPSLPTLLQVVKMKRQMTFQTSHSPTMSNFNSNTQDVHPGGLSKW